MESFGQLLRRARTAAGMSQSDVATRSGVARPNVNAYEADRREPRFGNAMALLEATGARLGIEPPIRWSWTDSLRPYAVPSRLWRLSPAAALRTIETQTHFWWSGPPRRFDLAVRHERARAYEVLLREGRPQDIECSVDGVLLCEVWDELVLPADLKRAWAPLISSGRDPQLSVAS